MGIGRLPRGVDLLHPLGFPHHDVAAGRAAVSAHGTGLADFWRRRSRRLVPGGLVALGIVVLVRRAGRQRRPAADAVRRHGRRGHGDHQLALHHRRTELRAALHRALTAAALLVVGDRVPVLPPLPLRGRRRPRPPTSGRSPGLGRGDRDGCLAGDHVVRRLQRRPHLLRHRHAGLRAVGGRRPRARRRRLVPTPASDDRGGGCEGVSSARDRRCHRSRRHRRAVVANHARIELDLPRWAPRLLAAVRRRRGRPRAGADGRDHPGAVGQADPGRWSGLLRPLPLPLADLPVADPGPHAPGGVAELRSADRRHDRSRVRVVASRRGAGADPPVAGSSLRPARHRRQGWPRCS